MNQRLRGLTLYAWAVLIAVLLWFQVHGQGESTLNMDVSLQLRGLADGMVLINELPDHVKVTISGLQARLKSLDEKKLYVSLSAEGLLEPVVVERPIEVEAIHLPPGLVVDNIQPDRLQLQVDRLVRKNIDVHPKFDLVEGWHVENETISPKSVAISGPEIWFEELTYLSTEALRPALQSGAFTLTARIVVPVGKALKLDKKDATFVVQGYLRDTNIKTKTAEMPLK
ncbi:MAG: CdaR family protein [Mariprofundaceae bacterium]|nr:CdaR family protein [Mariprofundaceae bacterium]